ncbi:MAG: ABC transporter permease [Firmicutes bacterium]|nr:ABC transporter permease [Bacillota bacterium]
MNSSGPVRKTPRSNQFGSMLYEREVLALLVAIIMWVAFGLINPRFLTWAGITDIIFSSTVIAAGALGSSMVIIAGEWDLSVGSMLALQATIIALLASSNVVTNLFVMILVVIVIGMVLGFINGILVSFGGLSSIIVTIGTMFVYRGLCLIIAGGRWFTSLPAWLTSVGQVSTFGIRPSLIIILVLTAILSLFMSQTRLGLWIYALGGNENALRLKGINVRWVKVLVFCTTGVLVGVAALILAGQYGYVQTDIGYDYVMATIAAAIVGGTSAFGGRGRIGGAIIGALLIGIMKTGLVAINIPAQWYNVVLGILILLSMTREMLQKRT